MGQWEKSNRKWDQGNVRGQSSCGLTKIFDFFSVWNCEPLEGFEQNEHGSFDCVH
jgi:hypothetical protein